MQAPIRESNYDLHIVAHNEIETPASCGADGFKPVRGHDRCYNIHVVIPKVKGFLGSTENYTFGFVACVDGGDADSVNTPTHVCSASCAGLDGLLC